MKSSDGADMLINHVGTLKSSRTVSNEDSGDSSISLTTSTPFSSQKKRRKLEKSYYETEDLLKKAIEIIEKKTDDQQIFFDCVGMLMRTRLSPKRQTQFQDKVRLLISDMIAEEQNEPEIEKDLCCELHMPNPEYECVGETGLAHCKQFTIKCSTASLERTATAASKKQAKQLAAEKIFMYLNENMHKRISEAAEQENFNAQFLRKSNEDAVAKYYEKTEVLWKPNIGQRVCDYHLGFAQSIEKELLEKATNILNSPVQLNPVKRLEDVLNVLQLEFEWNLIQGPYSHYALLKVPHVDPPIFITVPCDDPLTGKLKTANEALDYIKLSFSY